MTFRPLSGAVLSVLLAMLATSESPSSGRDVDGHRVFTIRSPGITESSSLVVSTVHPGLAYTANDSGGSATVYVLDTATGDVVGHTSLAGVEPVDVEAMAAGSDGSLLVADIGDNTGERDAVEVYRLSQPDNGDVLVTARRLTLTYADGPHDAESALYDAAADRVFVVTKEPLGAAVYATPGGAFGRDAATLRSVAPAPAVATDATFLSGGRFAVIRTYVGAAIYRYPSWQLVQSIALPSQQQGESVAAPPGGDVIWVGSEGIGSTVLAVRLPDLSGADGGAARPSTEPAPPESPSASSAVEPTSSLPSDDRSEPGSALLWLAPAAAAAAVVLVGPWWVARRRRTRRGMRRLD